MKDYLRPDFCFDGVDKISFEILKNNDIKYILLDLDNTLINYRKELKPSIIEWVKKAKEEGFQIYILSNSNKLEKVTKAAEALEIQFINSARKPLKKGFYKAIEKFKIEPQHTAMVGDQLFTDVIGGNRMDMFSIYVEPIDTKEAWYTSWKRPIEAWLLKKYKNV